jgi:hypothetical protein
MRASTFVLLKPNLPKKGHKEVLDERLLTCQLFWDSEYAFQFPKHSTLIMNLVDAFQYLNPEPYYEFACT